MGGGRLYVWAYAFYPRYKVSPQIVRAWCQGCYIVLTFKVNDKRASKTWRQMILLQDSCKMPSSSAPLYLLGMWIATKAEKWMLRTAENSKGIFTNQRGYFLHHCHGVLVISVPAFCILYMNWMQLIKHVLKLWLAYTPSSSIGDETALWGIDNCSLIWRGDIEGAARSTAGTRYLHLIYVLKLLAEILFPCGSTTSQIPEHIVLCNQYESVLYYCRFVAVRARPQCLSRYRI